MSEENVRCEQHFLDTHKRSSDGRYVVRLPFRAGPPIDIGSSRNTAALLYSKLERRLVKNLDLAKQYAEFLNEYKAIGHMEIVSNDEPTSFIPVYMLWSKPEA